MLRTTFQQTNYYHKLIFMLHNFEIAGEKVRLWQRPGETYEHIIMKALGYAMFVTKYPNLEIETKVGLRYKPDLVAQKGKRDFDFWGECGLNTIRKTAWILKHTSTKEFALFKIGFNTNSLIKQLRKDIPKKYRPPKRLILINFVKEIKHLTADKKIEKVPIEWFEKFEI